MFKKLFEKKQNNDLEERIQELDEKCKDLDPTTEEYSIYKKEQMDLIKLRNGNEENGKRNIKDYAGIAISLLGIFVPIIAHNKWNKEGYKFEETGSLTSTTFRETRQKRPNIKR